MAMKVENAATVRLFHGSRAGISGKIAPINRPECDFGKGFYLGTESSQPLTLISSTSGSSRYCVRSEYSAISE